MSGEENNPNSMNRVWALGELLPLQGKVLRSTETYIKKRQLSFSSSQKKKKQILLKIMRNVEHHRTHPQASI